MSVAVVRCIRRCFVLDSAAVSFFPLLIFLSFSFNVVTTKLNRPGYLCIILTYSKTITPATSLGGVRRPQSQLIIAP
ncbi:hypothetical protein F5Y13DRAFT_151347 [Hypoxylon sp. FL1857]|nr:hypothetical protein F5Y13DRAFT_151347 [Hypoxylon sp. FL1857]